MTPTAPTGPRPGLGHLLATRGHRPALLAYAVVVLAHWAEHLAQAAQIYVLGWPRPAAGGALGLVWPWLVKSEWMHYGYALVMMIAFVVLRNGFTGSSRTWWGVALWIQVWHHLEHLLLLAQAVTGAHLLGAAAPTSLAQLLFPRVELHLFYNTIVTIPMVVAMVLHARPRAGDPVAACTCAAPHRRALAAAAA